MHHDFLKPATFSDSMNQSVIAKFKGQLFKLMNKLEDTTPHFIRCIKPNSNQLPGLYEENHVLQQLRCCGVLEIVRISRSGYPTRLTHQELAVRYGCLLLDTRISQDPLSTSKAILKQCNLPPEMYQVGYTKIYLRTGVISVLEERKKYVLRGILGLQKQFRGYQTREYFHNMRNAAVILQSYIRGENARRNYIVVGESAIVSTAITKELDAAIHLQYMVRKWLARKLLNSTQQKNKPRNEKKKTRRKSTKRVSEDKELLSEQFEVQPCVLADLQSRVLKVEAAIMQKEDENTALQEELQRFEERWLENETRMKSMEDTWQKHMSSMQMSLAAACKVLAPDKTASHGTDSEDTMSFGTPTKELKGSLSDVNNLSTEFDQRSVIIHEDPKSLVEVKSDSISNRKQHAEELRRLKSRFEKWKKDYKTRLRETKARVRLNGDEGRHRNWWCKKSY